MTTPLPPDDDLAARLDAATPAPGPAAVEAALADVHGRTGARSRRLVAGAAVAAGLLVVAALAAVAIGGGDDGEVRAGPSEDGSTSTAPAGPPATTGDPDAWPATYATSGPTTLPPFPLPTPEERERAEALAMEVIDSAGEQVRGFGPGGTPELPLFTIDLRGDGWEVAERISEAVGASLRARTIEITVGGRWYPTGSAIAGGECPTLPTGPAPTDVEARIVLDPPAVRSGADLRGQVLVRATGAPVDHDTGAVEVGLVVREGTDEVVATWSGSMETIGISHTFTTGEDTAMGLVAGTERCGPDGPPGLAPGAYEVVWGRQGTDGQMVAVEARAPFEVSGW